jgi:sugar O-acyltransferase (sialic acid O-acetyltransferase NeuD family)
MIPIPYCEENLVFTKLYIIGAGGSGRETAWLANCSWGDKITAKFVVTQEHYLTPRTNNLDCILLSSIKGADDDARFVVAIGDIIARKQLADTCELMGLIATTIIHPGFEASQWVEIGNGTIISSGVIATTNIKIGRHVHINLACTISHDVEIGDYCTLSPGVHISGNVRIGRGVFIGTGANIINGMTNEPLTIGDNAVIAAGACVTKSVEPDSMVAGVPAIKKR